MAHKPSVKELLASRSSGEKDDWKLALIVEGGGMRGVVGVGAMMEIEKQGIGGVFDNYYGVSAGASSIISLISENTEVARKLFCQTFANGKLIHWKNVLKGKSPMRMDYLRERLSDELGNISSQSLLQLEDKAHIFATSTREGETVRMRLESREDIVDAVYYSSLMPVAGGMPDRRELLDGGLSTSGIPYREAIQDGNTHVLCVLTRPEGGHLKKTVRAGELAMAASLAVAGYRVAARLCMQLPQFYTRTLASIVEHSRREQADDVAVEVDFLRPARGEKEVAPHEQNPAVLDEGARSGERAVEIFLKNN